MATAGCVGDLNGDGVVTVAELVAAVNSALNGCAVDPTPTATPTMAEACGVGCSGPCYLGDPRDCPCPDTCTEFLHCGAGPGVDLCADRAGCVAALCPGADQ
jgi:hypothetical protein